MGYSYDEAMDRVKKITEAKRAYNRAAQNEPVITGEAEVTGSGKASIAGQAQSYYEWLRKNGFEQIAGKLENSGADEAEEYSDKLSKTLGRSKTRDYLYSLGEKYDLSAGDIDKLTVYNDNTGEVSFGGKNLGVPLAEVDSRAYYDTEKLEEAFEDYRKRSGLTKNLKNIYREGAEELAQQRKNVISKGNELFDRSFDDPYSTKTGRAIMESYGIRGEQAARNVQAAAAAKNSGNLDSAAMQAAAAANAANLAKAHDAVRAAKADDLQSAYRALMLVDEAKKYLGTPYKWGGNSPEEGGMDCSGYMVKVYKDAAGITLPRTTYEQVKRGTAVSKENLRPGDLVFFGSADNVHHVGMYIGGGQYIHEPKTGDVAKISNLSARSDFYGARRYTK